MTNNRGMSLHGQTDEAEMKRLWSAPGSNTGQHNDTNVKRNTQKRSKSTQSSSQDSLYPDTLIMNGHTVIIQ